MGDVAPSVAATPSTRAVVYASVDVDAVAVVIVNVNVVEDVDADVDVDFYRLCWSCGQ